MRKLSKVRNCPYKSFPLGTQDAAKEISDCCKDLETPRRSSRIAEGPSSCGLDINSYCNMIQVALYLLSVSRSVRNATG